MNFNIKLVEDMYSKHYPSWVIITYSILGAVVFFILGIWILSTGHPHEDAYILFKYVKNFVDGYGISYNPGGEPTEGVTDFLWMILISGLTYIGVDVAVSALILNSIGLFIIAFVILRNYFQKNFEWLEVFTGFGVIIILLFSQLVQASLGGFSTLFFSAFFILIFEIYINIKYKQYYLIPIYTILLTLTRPEGVIIGGLFCVLAYYDIYRTKASVKYANYLLVSVFVGVIYFLWRYQYFGILLPLPFYVKTSGGEWFSGITANFNWIKENKFLVFITILLIPLLKKKQMQFIKALFPLNIFLVFLCFIEMTQNFSLRYQSPLIAAMIFILPLFLKEFLQTPKRILNILVTTLIISFIFFPSLRQMKREIGILQKHEYINYFPHNLNQIDCKFNKIALTEAGKMAYWTDFIIVDLVGLNNNYTAKNKLDTVYLKNVDPDLIFIHTDNTLSNWDSNDDFIEAETDTFSND